MDLRGKLIKEDRTLLFNAPEKILPTMLYWRDTIRYIATERNRAIDAKNTKDAAQCQEQLDRLGGLVPVSSGLKSIGLPPKYLTLRW